MQKIKSGKIGGLLSIVLTIAVLIGGLVFYTSNKKEEVEEDVNLANLNRNEALEASALESIKDAKVRQEIQEVQALINQANKELNDLNTSSDDQSQ